MGMKLKSGADLCGFQLTNFCVQGEASAPSDAALGRKYFHTNATDDVATGISLLNRERIYLGEGAWRATAYLDDIAAINEKLNLITGDTDTDTLINNLKDLEEFLKDFSETDKLKSLLDGKLNKSGGTIAGGFGALNIKRDNNPYASGIQFSNSAGVLGYIGFNDDYSACIWDSSTAVMNTLIHSGNIGEYKAGGLAHSNGTVGAVVNSSGNVTIGNSDLAGTNCKLYVNGPSEADSLYVKGHLKFFAGGIKARNGYGIVWMDSTDHVHAEIMGYQNEFFIATNEQEALRIKSNGNVLIGATDDDNSGAKLQVNGLISSYSSSNGARHVFVGNANGTVSLYAATSGNRGLFDASISKWMVYTDGTDIIMPRDVHITGNLIVDGEVSAGGAGAEEGTSGSGSAEGVSEIFTPTSTSMAFDHNLGEDVIVQVYEKSGNVWNMVIVDTEITSATRVTLRFGKTETTQHKVVIMGV